MARMLTNVTRFHDTNLKTVWRCTSRTRVWRDLLQRVEWLEDGGRHRGFISPYFVNCVFFIYYTSIDWFIHLIPTPTPSLTPTGILPVYLILYHYPTTKPHPLHTPHILLLSTHYTYTILFLWVFLMMHIYFTTTLTTSPLHVDALEVFGCWGARGTCWWLWQESGGSLRTDVRILFLFEGGIFQSNFYVW